MPNPLVEDEFLLFGGECFDGRRCIFFDETLLFNVQTRSWTRLNLPIRPSSRSAHQTIMLPGTSRMLLFGGEFGSSKETKFLHFGDTWIFDFGTNNWQVLSLRDHPPSRSGHRLAAIGDYIFLFGGFQDVGSQAKYFDDLWIFDTNQLTWQKVDWMNEWESRPAARSGFTWISLPPHSDERGILLYGGYNQVKDRKGGWQGQVMNDLWLLRMTAGDCKTLRWKKLKLTPGAPLPRSGSSSVALPGGHCGFYNFGGVIDEEVSDEFLLGTCVNDLYQYEGTGGAWRRLDLDPTAASLGGRFNAMLAPRGQDSILIFGGIYEAGDQQFTLDDIHLVELTSGKVQLLQELSPELADCWKHKPVRPASESESEASSTDGSDDSTTTDESDATHSSSTSSAEDIPKAHRYASLKDFFDAHRTYWLEEARRTSATEGEVNDKQLRSVAFALAKNVWEDCKALEKDISLG